MNWLNIFKPKGIQEVESDDVRSARLRLMGNRTILDRPVREVIDTSNNHQLVVDLFTIATKRKFNWSADDWGIVINHLDENDLTVREWIGAKR